MPAIESSIPIVFADSDIVIIDKPGGLLAVPGRGLDKQDCAVSRTRALFPDLPAQPAVHRLDMYTSGLMIMARTSSAHRNLSQQFAERKTQKIYIALLEYPLFAEQGTIALHFRLDTDNRPHQIYDPKHGKLGITHWKKIGMTGDYTRVEFQPVTGRTHQLRLHAAHKLGLSSPIVGDHLYGNGREGDKMLLHACSLRFIHPGSGKEVAYHSPPPF